MATAPSKMTITLQLGEHTMRFPIDWNEEKYFRDAASLLNSRFKYYSSGMKGKSAEQIWVYVALEAAVNLQRENARYDIQPILERLSELNNKITDVLSQ